MLRYVTIKKFAAESGYTEEAIRSKIGAVKRASFLARYNR